jgi:hypothetical protein
MASSSGSLWLEHSYVTLDHALVEGLLTLPVFLVTSMDGANIIKLLSWRDRICRSWLLCEQVHIDIVKL